MCWEPHNIDLDEMAKQRLSLRLVMRGFTHLVALSGKDCSVRFDKPTPGPGCSNLGAADLDGDGKAEVVAVASGVTVFGSTGSVLTSRSKMGQDCCVFAITRLRLLISTGKDRQRCCRCGSIPLHKQSKAAASAFVEQNLIEEGAWGTIPLSLISTETARNRSHHGTQCV